jgi:hypothetical protein
MVSKRFYPLVYLVTVFRFFPPETEEPEIFMKTWFTSSLRDSKLKVSGNQKTIAF